MAIPSNTRVDSFTEFVREVEPRPQRALIARFGPELGRDSAAEALAWAWEHWDRVTGLENAAGYLYRVGVSKARSLRRPGALMPAVDDVRSPWVEPALPGALERLSDRQRTVVLLVYSMGWKHREVAETLGMRTGTVRKHLERGMAKLRASLKVTDDA